MSAPQCAIGAAPAGGGVSGTGAIQIDANGSFVANGGGLTTVWLLQVGYRALQAGMFALFWQRRTWAHIKI